jgi:DMSO/TMAO reductase YedYZ molybdopterin-dependent catalytic subunit
MTRDLIDRRLAYVKRQMTLDTGSVNVRFARATPRGSGSPNRHGMPQLPVGQHEVKNWPVLDLGEQPEIDHASWKLEVGGLVENAVTLDWDAFHGAAPGRRCERLSLRDHVEPLR